MSLWLFYQELLESRTMCSVLDEAVFDYGLCVAEDAHAQLVAVVTDDEIKGAIFSIPDDKAPGLDGYSSQFLKSAWNTVGPLLVEAVKEFFDTG